MFYFSLCFSYDSTYKDAAGIWLIKNFLIDLSTLIYWFWQRIILSCVSLRDWKEVRVDVGLIETYLGPDFYMKLLVFMILYLFLLKRGDKKVIFWAENKLYYFIWL